MKHLNEQQLVAFKNPCYTEQEILNPIFEQESSIAEFRIKSKLNVLAFTGNELWNATVFVYSKDGDLLEKSKIPVEIHPEIQKTLNDLLNSVGSGEIIFLTDEANFEAARMCSVFERKKLPRANLEKFFKFSEMQNFARRNPNPSIEDMILRKYTRVVNFGGAKYSMILTAVHKFGESKWHASISVLNEKNNPMVIFKEMPAVYGDMALKLLKKMLNGVGVGEFGMLKPKKGDLVFNMFRDMSKDEIKSMPKNFDFALGKKSPSFDNRFFN